MKKGTETKQRILKDARKLFITNGFKGTSISDIIHETGAKKGNLYYHYASKHELGLAVLEDAKADFITLLDNSFSGNSSLEKIIQSIETIFSAIKMTDLTAGCLFGNTALEMTDTNSQFATIIRDVFAHWVDRLEEQIIQGKRDKTVRVHGDPRLLAKLIVASIEGAIMMARVNNSEQELDDCLHILKTLLSK